MQGARSPGWAPVEEAWNPGQVHRLLPWAMGQAGVTLGGRWGRADNGTAFHRRTDTSITCTVPEGTLPAPVSVCVRFEHRGCVRSNLTFHYMQNPVITAISPRRSPVR